MKLIKFKIFFIILTASILWSCSYSFTGSSVPAHLKTIAIPIVKDRTGSGEASLSNDFTQILIQQFIDDNNLQVVNTVSADAVLSVTITSMPDRAEVVSGEEEKATKRRITLNVQAVYKDLVEKKTVFDKKFSNYGTYETDNFTENRLIAIEVAIDNVTLDLLLAVVADW
ncbi:MAG: LptE family protein [Melioribacteraceae bacterium]|nr:LptE family protein [Melioribacteraceae bacterium]